MSRIINYVPRVMFFLAGVTAAAVTLARRERAGRDPAATEESKMSLANLETRLQTREEAAAARLFQVETRLEEHAARLADIPSTSQMVSAIDQVLSRTMASLETRLEIREEADIARFSRVETRLEEHAAKLADLPSTGQIVSAMDQVLSRTMASLDERLKAQAQSSEVLKTTVSQTDSLLERVLESLDSLRSYTDPKDLAENPLSRRPTV